MRASGNPVEAAGSGYKATADADGTLPAIACATGIDLTKYDGPILAVIGITHSGAGAVSFTVRPRAGAVAAVDGTWADASPGGDVAVTGDCGAGGYFSTVVEIPKHVFGDKRYGAVNILAGGTIPATAVLDVKLLAHAKRYV